MKLPQLNRLLLLAAILISLCSGSSVTAQTVYNYPGNYSYTVPTGITSITVEVMGAKGGDNYSSGGYGGYVTCSLTVTPGEVLYVNVGGVGGNGYYWGAGSGGYNGGGSNTYRQGAGGGGATDIMRSPYTLYDRVVVAGGGGGAGYRCGGGDYGGNGGDLTGQGGALCWSYYNGGYTAYGGDQYNGGSGAWYGGNSGYFGQGGDGNSYGGGGGGGWYGGGGGYDGGGGGGSSYTDPTIATNVSHSQGYNGGNGYVSITENCTAGTITGSDAVCTGYTTTLANTEVPGGIWSSDDNGIASIDPNTGEVTGNSAGYVTISYEANLACGTVYAYFGFTVSDPPSAISGPNTICQNQTSSYSSSSGGIWSINDGSIAYIDPYSGVATGYNAGVTTITYQVGTSCYETKTVTVLATSSLGGTKNVCAGLTRVLTSGIPSGTWSSNNTGLATVIPSTGVVTGVAAGSPTIQYLQPNGCVVTTPFTVHPLPVVIGGVVPICKGLSITVSESSTGGTWSSASTGVATVNAVTTTTGTITGISPGTTTITYTLPTGCIMTSSVLINPLPVPITAPLQGSCVTDLYNPTITLVNGTGTGTWSSSNTGVASILSFSGELTSLTPGTTTITYTLPSTNCIATTIVRVNPLPAVITGTQVVCANRETYLSNSSLGGTWTSSNVSMAVVDPGAGIVRGISGLNTPTISYTLPTGCLRTTTITVNEAPGPVSGSVILCNGATSTLTAGGGGTWSSSSPLFATITAGPGAGGGIVTGLLPGSTTVTYTLPGTGCYSTTEVTINDAPAQITGVAQLCESSTTTLNNATPGGAWSSANTMVATVSGGVVSAVSASTTDIAYTLPNGCKTTKAVTVNALPIAYNLYQTSGKTSYCPGDAGIDLTLNASNTGITYYLYQDGVLVNQLAGTGSAINFGLQTGQGTYTARATDDITGCASNMTGSPIININTPPTIFNVGSLGSTTTYCDVPGAGVEITLSGSQNSFEYTLFVDGVPAGAAYGTGGPISFGVQSTAGIYTVIATDPNPSLRCESKMSGSVTVSKILRPAIHNVIAEITPAGAGKYCAGTPGVHVSMDQANTGIRYDLYEGTTLKATGMGANASLDFGVFPAGTYTAIATNAITGCTEVMSGSAVVTQVALPTPQLFQVAGGGSSSYCAGGTGIQLMLGGSDNAISYQLFNGTTPVGIPEPGNGGTINFGLHTVAGNYTVIATDDMTSCSVNMTGTVAVASYPALDNYTVTIDNGGNYCAGTGGVHVRLSGSKTGVKYDLINNGIVVDTKPTGTGSALDFGLYTSAGAYTVVATSSTGCTANMTGSPVITINTLPSVYNVTVTNGGNYCSGDAGVHVGVSFSDAGISYQLFNGTTPVGTALPGSSSNIDFGVFSATGTYTVKATNTTTTCASNMNGSAVVKVNSKPVAYGISGGGSYCDGSTTGVPVGVANSATGVDYQLFNGTTPVGPLVSGTGSAISFGNYTTTGYYTVVGTDATTGCANSMTGSTVITIDPLPIAYSVTGGGTECAGGAGFHIGLNNSTIGVTYQLFNGSTGISTLPGTGGALDFGSTTLPGNYTVVANTVISGCTNDMMGNAVINTNPLPSVFTVSGGGGLCAGSAGVAVNLSGTEPGVNYQPYIGTTAIGSPVAGTGAMLSLGLQTTAGTYTVKAINAATGCTENMSGTAIVTINATPLSYTVTGSGTICDGDAGPHIILSGSQSSADYQLYNSGVPVSGGNITGTGGLLDFGTQSAAGSYTIVGTNTTTGCANSMAGSGKVVVNAAPVAFAVTGGGNYCMADAGVAVGLAGSMPGMNYQLYNSATAVGMPVGGTGSPITFGLQKGSGIYTVVASNTSTTCAATMTGSVPVVEDPMVTPVVTIGGTDGKACIGDVVNYTVTSINGGTAPSYIWKVGGLPKATGTTFSTIPVIGDVITVEMTSNAYCASVTEVTNTVAMDMIPYVMPTATVIVNPGVAICKGTDVTMWATTTDGGVAPGESWLKNGKFVGSTTNLNATAIEDGDVFVFMLRSDLRCRMSDTVFSDPIVMDVDVAEVPEFRIKSHVDTAAVAVGSVDSFTVEFAAGKKPKGVLSYQWYIQGAKVPGATLPVFIDHNIYDNNKVSCEVTKTGACGEQSATRETTVHLKNLAVKDVEGNVQITVLPNPNKGFFTVKGSLGLTTDTEVSFEITNMLGQTVYAGKAMTSNGAINKQIQLNNTLANGMYTLSVRSSAISKVFHIVVER